MVMELVDVHADLEALRKLYVLLQNSSVDGTQQLDERAKIVLKSLLDGATEKALETHTKIITAAQSSVSISQQQFNVAPKMKKDAANCHNKFTSTDDLQRGKKQRGSGTAPSKSGAHDGQQRRNRVGGFVKENEKMRESVKSSTRGKRINQVQSRAVSNIAVAAGSRVGNALAIRRIQCGVSDMDHANSKHGRGFGVARTSECLLCSNNNKNNNNNKEKQLVDQLPMKMAGKETVRFSGLRPVPSAKKKLPPPRRRVMVRPTLLEPESESESDERNGTSASASWPTQHTTITDTESTETKSLPRASFAYGHDGDYGSNSYSDTDTRRSGNSSSSPSPSSSYSSFVTSRSRLNPKEDKPAIGRLRRFKNKLALIFHHHHHHHHHHHYDHESDHSKVRNSQTMWKHIQNNMLHHKNKRHKNEICGNFTGTKSKPQQQQQQQQANYFRTLVQGLLRRQARHSKKSNLPKGGIVVKKLHWWHMFKRRRGLKLGPKTRTIKMK